MTIRLDPQTLMIEQMRSQQTAGMILEYSMKILFNECENAFRIFIPKPCKAVLTFTRENVLYTFLIKEGGN